MLRGRGAEVGVRAPLWFVRLAGATLGAAIFWLAHALGLWRVIGAPGWIAQSALVVIGALLAPSAFGIVLWWMSSALVVTLMLVMYTPLVHPFVAPYVRADVPSPDPIDAVIVLSGSVSDDGRIMGQAVDRLLSAIAIAKKRQVRELALSIVTQERRSPPANSEADQRALVALAAPELSVRFVSKVYSTRDEALAFAALANTAGWRRVIVVTSPLHTRRACAAFEHEGLRVECHVAASRDYSLNHLEYSENRRLAFHDVLYEFVATRLYRARGWIR